MAWYEWVFSGIGVVCLTTFGGWGIKKITQRKKNNSKQTEENSSINSEMFKELSNNIAQLTGSISVLAGQRGIEWYDGKDNDFDFSQNYIQNIVGNIQQCRRFAEEDNAVAQCNLGYCYLKGINVLQNHIEAVKWFTKAAEQGYGKAKVALKRL